MQSGLGFGSTTEEVMKTMTQIAQTAKKVHSVQLYMPPRIVDEFLSFFENKEQTVIKELLAEIMMQSPQIDSVRFPAAVFYTLVDDIRGRSYRGLRVGEEEIEQAAQIATKLGTVSKIEFQKQTGKAIRGFRERYRIATRVGFLDSVADLDIITLAKELEGTVVSTDEGVLKWSRLFGAKEMIPSVFGQKMSAYVKPLHHQE